MDGLHRPQNGQHRALRKPASAVDLATADAASAVLLLAERVGVMAHKARGIRGKYSRIRVSGGELAARDKSDDNPFLS